MRELSSVRESKLGLTRSLLEANVPRVNVRAALGTATQPVAALNAPVRRLAMGVAAWRGGEYRLAVRIQHRVMERGPELEMILEQARGEVDVRYIGAVGVVQPRRETETPFRCITMSQTIETPGLEAARSAKALARTIFAAFAPVVGVGITRIAGVYGVKVNLRRGPAAGAVLPADIDGVPVRVEVVGPVTKRNA